MENEGKQPVVVTDVRMPFWSMVAFMIKWAFASIPALIVLSMFAFVCYGVLLGVVAGVKEPAFPRAGRQAPVAAEEHEPTVQASSHEPYLLVPLIFVGEI